LSLWLLSQSPIGFGIRFHQALVISPGLVVPPSIGSATFGVALTYTQQMQSLPSLMKLTEKTYQKASRVSGIRAYTHHFGPVAKILPAVVFRADIKGFLERKMYDQRFRAACRYALGLQQHFKLRVVHRRQLQASESVVPALGTTVLSSPSAAPFACAFHGSHHNRNLPSNGECRDKMGLP
jgi:hypothetical protein